MTEAEFDVLLITKPIAPPWTDGTLNLVRSLIQDPSLGCRFRVPVPTGSPNLQIPHVIEEAIYPEAGSHGTTLKNNAAMLKRLLKPSQAQIMHFLFAPSTRTARILKPLLSFREIPTIHTLCSRPKSFERVSETLFAKHHIVLSKFTEAKLREAGVPSVARVNPAVFEPKPNAESGLNIAQEIGVPENTPFLMYAGDLEFSRGAETVIRALPEALQSIPHHIILACREKTNRASELRKELQELAERLGVGERTHFAGTVPDFHSLLSRTDLLLFPTANTYAKLDLPLVLLEALAMGIPIMVAEEGPVGELLEDDIGFGVAGENAGELSAALHDVLTKGAPRKEKSEACRNVFERKFQAKLHAQAVGKLYRKWIS